MAAGVPVEVVSRILGHSSISVTADIYQHAVPQLQRDATAKVASLVFGSSVVQ